MWLWLGGQGFAKTSSGRIIITKGGFLRDIYYSDDDGLNWSNATNGNIDWEQTIIADNGHIFVVSNGGTGMFGLLKSTDNGTTWSSANADVPIL